MSDLMKANLGMVGEERSPQHTDQHLSGLRRARGVFGYDSKDGADARCRASPLHGVALPCREPRGAARVRGRTDVNVGCGAKASWQALKKSP